MWWKAICAAGLLGAGLLAAGNSSAVAKGEAVPTGKQVLDRMLASVRASNSFHLRYIVDETQSTGIEEVTRHDADIALRQHLERLQVGMTAVAPGSRHAKRHFAEQQVVLVAGTRGAEHHPGIDWLCTAGYTDQTPPALISLHSDQILSIRNAGPATADHVAVWHVVIQAEHRQSAQNLRISVHEYIARSGYHLVREASNVAYTQLGGPRIQDRLTADYTRWGEAVHVKVPACRQP